MVGSGLGYSTASITHGVHGIQWLMDASEQAQEILLDGLTSVDVSEYGIAFRKESDAARSRNPSDCKS